MSDTNRRMRVVIVGAGFAGLECARALARAPVDITILDRTNHHLFQPLLYQVATAALSPGDVAWPIRSIFRGQRNVTVLMAEVTGVDPAARVVRTAGGDTVPYDALLLATGATHSYFGNDAWAEVAPGLKVIEDATAIRRRLLLAFEAAELAPDEAARRRLLTFVVIGGGPTGVELAGSLAEVAHRALRGEFRRSHPDRARILLIEAGPRVLASFPEDLSAEAHRSLERMGVEVLTDTRVTGVDQGGVTVGGERIEASSVVWAAGVRASAAGEWLDAPRDRARRIQVGPDLTVPGHPDIFAAGDTVAALDSKGQPVPGTAPAAKQMGRHIGRVLAARARDGGRDGGAPPPFSYRHLGNLATIGRRSAVVDLGRIKLRGVIGWWFWGIVHVFTLIGFRSRVVVSFIWLWSYLTSQRGARLITGAAPPRVDADTAFVTADDRVDRAA